MASARVKREVDEFLKRHGYVPPRAEPAIRKPKGPLEKFRHAKSDRRPRVHSNKKVRQQPTGRKVFAEHERNHHITTSGRRALSAAQFALPPGPEEKRRGIKGRLPIDTLKRARNALARASMEKNRGTITIAQYRRARAKVLRAWPSIDRD